MIEGLNVRAHPLVGPVALPRLLFLSGRRIHLFESAASVEE
jgi:hypothetical protein